MTIRDGILILMALFVFTVFFISLALTAINCAESNSNGILVRGVFWFECADRI